MEIFDNVNVLKLIFHSFALSKSKQLFLLLKNHLINPILLEILNIKKLFKLTGKPGHIIMAHDNMIKSLSLITNNLVSISEDLTLKVWNTDTKKCLRTLEEDEDMAISSVIKLRDDLIAYSTREVIKIINFNNFNCINVIYPEKCCWFDNLTLLPNGHIAFSAMYRETEYYIIILDPSNDYSIINRLPAHNGIICALTCLDSRFASAGEDSIIKIWNIDNNSYVCHKSLNGHSAVVLVLLYIQDYDLLLSGSMDKTIKVWNINDSQCIQTIEAHEDGVFSLLYLPNGYFASSSWSGTIKVWRLLDYQCVNVFNGHGDFSTTLLLLAGNRLASTCDGKIFIWD
jgi:WD40 repeat protein